jgi:hypothetical protein
LTAIVNGNTLSTNEFHVPVSIENNYPNPFNDYTWIAFKVERPSHVTVRVVDVFGKEITRIYDNELLQPGRYIEHFDSRLFGLSSGVYFFKVDTQLKTFTRKMVLL